MGFVNTNAQLNEAYLQAVEKYLVDEYVDIKWQCPSWHTKSYWPPVITVLGLIFVEGHNDTDLDDTTSRSLLCLFAGSMLFLIHWCPRPKHACITS